MPLYEGIGVVGDKNAVVLDIGASFTKCGFAGELSPRAIIPSERKDWKSGTVTKIVDYTRKAEDQFKVFAEFLHNIYYRILLVNAKERRVVVIESVLCPTVYRETLASVLFKQFEVPSVLFAPSHLAACFTLGNQSQSALVVDVGFQECLVLPICEGVPMLNCWEAAPLGGRCVERKLRQLIFDDCSFVTAEGPRKISEAPELLTDDVLEDVKVRGCFTTSLPRSQAITAAKGGKLPADFKLAPGFDYPLSGDKILHIGSRAREMAFDVLFDDAEQEKSIPILILESLLRCPIDLRKPLAERICVIGGTSMTDGFLARLKAELHALVDSEARYGTKLPLKSFKFYAPPAKANYAAWLGGSIFGSLEILPHRSVSRDAYLADPKLPDWTKFSGKSGLAVVSGAASG